MQQVILRPQDTRFISALLGLTGGAVDIFSHLQYDSLVATQTGNIILLVSAVKEDNLSASSLRILSILWFSAGFLIAHFLKNHLLSKYRQIYNILPLFFTTLSIPLLPQITYLLVSLLSFSTGILMLAFSDSKIEQYPYTIMMTSGNYRNTLQKSNSNFVSFTLPYASTACGLPPSLLFDFY